MSKKERQSKCEQTWAEIFFSYINDKYNFDYQIKSPPNQISAIDVIGISKSGKFPELKTELTQALLFEDSKNGIAHLDCDQVENRIDEKIAYYNKKLINLTDKILLIQGHINYVDMKCDIIQLRKKYITAPFKGIYYIKCPDYNKNNSFVMSIKNAF